MHRTVLGSMERFCGGLIEHYAGAFPTWLAPEQVAILPIADRHQEYAQKVAAQLRAKLLRVKCDDRSETIKYKIREAQLEQIPYMLVIGDKEVESGMVTPRHRRAGDMPAVSLEQFISEIETEIKERR